MSVDVNDGIALTCEPEGSILEVIRDDFGITQKPRADRA